MTTRTIRVPSILTIRSGALHGLPEDLTANFDVRRVLVVAAPRSGMRHAIDLARRLEAHGSSVEVRAESDGSQQGASALLGRMVETRPTLVVAIGGGRPIDVAKLAGARTGVDFVAVPTALSHDGMCSPVASLIDGAGVRRSLAARMPAGVVIDLDIVRQAPAAFVRAGIGDLVSNLTAVEDWRLAAAHGHEPFDELAASIALQSAAPALDVAWPLDEPGWQTVARGLVMSGLAMEVAGSSRPCSGAEHLISHALDELLGSHARPHGEQVALGVLLVAGTNGEPARRIRELFERVGFPTTLSGWSVDAEMLAAAIRLAPRMRPGRMTVLDQLEQRGRSADQLVLDAFGTTA